MPHPRSIAQCHDWFMHVHPVAPEDAQGAVKELYDKVEAAQGYLPNQVRLFSLNPEARSGWRQLIGAISDKMDPRRYELVTLAAARQLRCQYA